jgi:hypothetical protein
VDEWAVGMLTGGAGWAEDRDFVAASFFGGTRRILLGAWRVDSLAMPWVMCYLGYGFGGEAEREHTWRACVGRWE